MKANIKAIVVAGAVFALLAPVQAQVGLANSAHNFSTNTWNTAGEMCQPCHAPHANQYGVTDMPLWNHQVNTNASPYTVYSNASSLDATDVGQPSGVSLLCLGCHDGTVALDDFGHSPTQTTYMNANDNGAAYFSTDLSDDHPISFTYDDDLANTDGELHTPSDTNTSLGNPIADDLLIAGKVECASCHDVHNAYDNDYLLKIDNAASALCLTCHDK